MRLLLVGMANRKAPPLLNYIKLQYSNGTPRVYSVPWGQAGAGANLGLLCAICEAHSQRRYECEAYSHSNHECEDHSHLSCMDPVCAPTGVPTQVHSVQTLQRTDTDVSCEQV